MKDILFSSHLGVGDQISCCGIVHYLRRTYSRKIYVPTKKQNIPNISFLYQDFDDIEVVEIEGKNEEREITSIIKSKDLELVKTFVPWGNHYTDKYWDESFYKILGLDYSIKHEYAKLPMVDEQEIMDKHVSVEGEYAFVYDDPDRNFTFTPKTNLPIVKNINELNMFEMAPIMKNAAEIHTMIGGLICVMELLQLPLEGQKGFLYRIRDDLNFYNKEKFEVII